MTSRSEIQWTEHTWNPQSGCSRVSSGCLNCYALMHAHRLSGNPNAKISSAYDGSTVRHKSGQLDWTGQIQLLPDRLDDPLQIAKPSLFFVNSMTDLFHEAVPDAWIQRVFGVMAAAHWHTFQVLTKRGSRLRSLGPDLSWAPNIWMGVSVESEAHIARIDDLRATDASIKFLSLEPLLTALPNLDLNGIAWVIVGGESGPGARPIDPAWVRDLRDQCTASEVPFFFKQWGGIRKKATGRILDGRTWDELPRRKEQR